MNDEIEQSGGRDLPYEVILKLDDEKYLPAAQGLARLFKKDVDKNGNLDFENAMATVKAQPDLAIMGTVNSTYKQSKKTLGVLANGIAEVVESAGALSLSGGGNKFNEVLEGVFGDLKKQKGKPWFVIAASDGGDGGDIGKTVYTYNFFYASHSALTGSLLSACLLLFRVSTDASVENLWGSDEHEGDQSGDGSASESATASSQSGVRIKYEKYEVKIEIKGFTLVKPVG